MRPEIATRIVQKAIDTYLSEGKAHKLNEAKCAEALGRLDRVLRKDFARGGYTYDERNPYEVGGYGECPRYEMMYISDRFMAPHRLNWLIVGVRDGQFVDWEPG